MELNQRSRQDRKLPKRGSWRFELDHFSQTAVNRKAFPAFAEAASEPGSPPVIAETRKRRRYRVARRIKSRFDDEYFPILSAQIPVKLNSNCWQRSTKPLPKAIGGKCALSPALPPAYSRRSQPTYCEGGPMNIIPLIIYAAELALAAIILFYVIEMLTIPANMKRVCQALIILIAVLSVVGLLLGSEPPPASHVGPLFPNSPTNPSIIR